MIEGQMMRHEHFNVGVLLCLAPGLFPSEGFFEVSDDATGICIYPLLALPTRPIHGCRCVWLNSLHRPLRLPFQSWLKFSDI